MQRLGIGSGCVSAAGISLARPRGRDRRRRRRCRAISRWRSLHAPLPIPAEGASLEVSSGTPLRRVMRRARASAVSYEHPRCSTCTRAHAAMRRRIRAGEYQLEPGLTPLVARRHSSSRGRSICTSSPSSRAGASPTFSPRSARTGDSRRLARRRRRSWRSSASPACTPKAQFFPDTYCFPHGTTELELLRAPPTQALREHLAKAWEARDPDTQLRRPVRSADSRVDHREGNRAGLRAHADLRSVPAAPRARHAPADGSDRDLRLGETFDGNLRRQDLERDTPYNTYTRARPAADADRAAGQCVARGGGRNRELTRRAVLRRDRARRWQPPRSPRRSRSTSAPCATTCGGCAARSHSVVRGAFVTLEGREGVGKIDATSRSSCGMLEHARTSTSLTTREPGGTPFGETIRAWILDGEHGALSGRGRGRC